MRKIMRALVISAVVGGLGVPATGIASANAASSQIRHHGQPASRDTYQQPQGRVSLPYDGNQNPPQAVARPDGGSDQPPQDTVAI